MASKLVRCNNWFFTPACIFLGRMKRQWGESKKKVGKGGFSIL